MMPVEAAAHRITFRPVSSASARALAIRAGNGAVWLGSFLLVLYLALKNGGFDVVERSEVGVAVWWIVVVGTVVGAFAPGGESRTGRILLVVLALFAGWTAAALPFFPTLFAPLLALLAGALTLARPRLGLAFTLAVPVLPLGNISSGLAFAYAALAAGWLALSWRSPRQGLFLALGPLLAPLLALGLLPLAAQAIGNRVRRAIQVAAAVLLAAVVAGLRQAPLPFTGDTPPQGLGVAGSGDPLAVASALVRALAAHPALLVEALVFAAAAVALPHARERGLWGIAGLGAGLIACAVLPVPAVAAAPLVVAGWSTCIILALQARS